MVIGVLKKISNLVCPSLYLTWMEWVTQPNRLVHLNRPQGPPGGQSHFRCHHEVHITGGWWLVHFELRVIFIGNSAAPSYFYIPRMGDLGLGSGIYVCLRMMCTSICCQFSKEPEKSVEWNELPMAICDFQTTNLGNLIYGGQTILYI